MFGVFDTEMFAINNATKFTEIELSTLLRIVGVDKGKWVTSLITPDKKELTSQMDLKLYIAKSGAVIDANIINFSLPKKIAKIDKNLEKLLAKSDVEMKQVEVDKTDASLETDCCEENKEEEEEMEEEVDKGQTEKEKKDKKEKKVKREMKKLGFCDEQKISIRRETKIPLKYRLDDPVTSPTVKKVKPVKTPNKALQDFELEQKDKFAEDAKIESWKDPETTLPTGPSFVAVKSVPPPPPPPTSPFESSMSSAPDLLSIGVGTFAIDQETAKRKFSV